MSLDNKTQPPASPDLRESDLWGNPPMGDGAFLVAVRSRISPARTAPVWLSAKALAGVSALCVLLLIAVWLPGGWNDATRMPAEMLSLESVVDEADAAAIDPAELAAYLGVEVTETSEVTGTEYDVEIISTDELLSLDEGEFETVISQLEQARFF